MLTELKWYEPLKLKKLLYNSVIKKRRGETPKTFIEVGHQIEIIIVSWPNLSIK